MPKTLSPIARARVMQIRREIEKVLAEQTPEAIERAARLQEEIDRITEAVRG